MQDESEEEEVEPDDREDGERNPDLPSLSSLRNGDLLRTLGIGCTVIRFLKPPDGFAGTRGRGLGRTHKLPVPGGHERRSHTLMSIFDLSRECQGR